MKEDINIQLKQFRTKLGLYYPAGLSVFSAVQ